MLFGHAKRESAVCHSGAETGDPQSGLKHEGDLAGERYRAGQGGFVVRPPLSTGESAKSGMPRSQARFGATPTPSENLPRLSTTRPLRPPASIADAGHTTNACLRLLNEDCETQPNALRENQFMIRRDAPSIAASNASRRSATALRRHLECRPGVVS